MASKTQLGPRVDAELAERYKRFVRHRNEGMYKGKLGDEIEQAMRLQMAAYFAAHPSEITCIDDADALKDTIEDVQALEAVIVEAANNVDRVTSRLIREYRTPESGVDAESDFAEADGRRRSGPTTDDVRDAGSTRMDGPRTGTFRGHHLRTDPRERTTQLERVHERIDRLEAAVHELSTRVNDTDRRSENEEE